MNKEEIKDWLIYIVKYSVRLKELMPEKTDKEISEMLKTKIESLAEGIFKGKMEWVR